jgi:hypothetical protein
MACRAEIECDSKRLYQCQSLKTNSIVETSILKIAKAPPFMQTSTQKTLASFTMTIESLSLLLSYLENTIQKTNHLSAILEIIMSQRECCIRFGDAYDTRIGFSVDVAVGTTTPVFEGATSEKRLKIDIQHLLKVPIELCDDKNRLQFVFLNDNIASQPHMLKLQTLDVNDVAEFQCCFPIKRIT